MLWQARSEAQRVRAPVLIFFGDDPALLPVKPIAGVLPSKGIMQMWSCQWGVGNSDFYDREEPPYWVENPAQQCPDWYPFRTQIGNLTAIGGSLPEGIRVLCGDLFILPNGPNWDHEFRCTAYKQDPIGEIKRHQTGYGANGSVAAAGVSGYNCYCTILVYEETSGDYQLIQVAAPGWSTHPQMIPDRIKTIMLKPLKTQLDLPRMLKTITPDR
jgi:hypothetical protein